MQFEQQTITIRDDREKEVAVIPAMVAVGTGLAYHKHYQGNGQFLQTYGVTHIQSGISVKVDLEFVTEEAARRFISLIQAFCDWNLSSDDLWKLNRSAMTVKLLEAYRQAEGIAA